MNTDQLDAKYIVEDHSLHEIKKMREIFPEAMERAKRGAMGIEFKRFPGLTKATGGFRMNEFTVLCGSTGSGKSTLLANWSVCLIEQQVPHLVVSIETGPHDYVLRMVSAIEKENLNRGEPLAEERVNAVFLHNDNTYMHGEAYFSPHEDRVSVEELMSEIYKCVKKYGVKVVFIDNLNFLLKVTRASDQLVELDRTMHELIIFVKQVPVHIVMVCHPRKTENGRVVSEYDVKGSSTAVQEAHNVFLWNRPTKKDMDDGRRDKLDRELTISKMRRNGTYTGYRMIFKTSDGVSYEEGPVYES